MYYLIDGKALAEQLLNELRENIVKKDIHPGLAVILVGDNKASSIYVQKKLDAAKSVGIFTQPIYLDSDASKEKILYEINACNANDDIHGMIVQLPLPVMEWGNEAIATIDPRKDADGFHPLTLKSLREGKRDILPVMSRVILYILKQINYDLTGKKVLIIAYNPSFIEGQKILLEELGGTVLSCLPEDPHLANLTSQADVLIAAGRTPYLITEPMVKDQAIVIDIGIMKLPNGKTVGCVDFPNVAPKCKAITPVPFGIGPLTVAFLLKNVYEAALR